MQQLSLFETTNTLPIEYYPGFLNNTEANTLFAQCKALAWQQNKSRMLGKPLQVPRLECMYGEPGASYLYSNSVTLEAHPWTNELLYVCDRITVKTGFAFDIVIGNRYRTGLDSIGWHSDDEPSMGYRPAIASVSLEACRKFSIKPKIKGSKSTHFWLEHGSLLLMLPRCQEGYTHQLPKDDKCSLERINLTFRPNEWKSALGQVLAYAGFHPNKTARIHLFGTILESSIIVQTCASLGVKVTFEEDWHG